MIETTMTVAAFAFLFIFGTIDTQGISPRMLHKNQETTQQQPALEEASELSKQVVKLYNEKKYDEALPIAKRALSLRDKVLDKQHSLVAEALVNLASVYLGLRDYDNAEPLYRRILGIQETVFGPNDLKLTKTLDMLAWLSYFIGRKVRAEELFLRAFSIREKSLGKSDGDVANSALNLARFYQKISAYQKSLAFYERALEIKEKLLGTMHRDLAEVLEQCACAKRQTDNAKDAEKLEARAFEILRNENKYPGRMSYVPGTVLLGKAITKAEAEIPYYIPRSQVKGTVVVEVIIDEAGKVIEAKLRCGPDSLALSAVEAAYKWRFKPTTLDGNPIKVAGVIIFNFRW